MKYKRLIDCIANLYDITSEDILGKCRKAHISEARMMVAYILRHVGYSFTEIGEILNRHHTSVIYFLRVFDSRYKYEVGFRDRISKMLELVDYYGEEAGKTKKERECKSEKNGWR